MFEVRDNLDQLAHWEALNRGETVDWSSVFAGYRSQVEWPGAHYWRELRQANPNAKVILSVRDPDAWFDSIMETIVPSITEGRTKYADPYQRAVSRMIYQMIYQGRFGGKMEDRNHATRVFSEHNQAVIDGVPRDQLLVYDVADGWPKLCEFLRVDVPDRPFPVSNSSSTFLQRTLDLRLPERGSQGTRSGETGNRPI